MTEKKHTQYDLIIVGSGPSGMTASIYASRRNLKTLIISKIVGGQMNLTNEVENYPGFEFITGAELALKMQAQSQKWGTEFQAGEVTSIIKEDQIFIIKTKSKQYTARAVILSFGLTPRNLQVPGEEELTGRGVAYCATCDGPLFKGKTVAVAGGGNSALEAVEYLSQIAKYVYLINNSDKFTAAPYLLDRAKKLKNVDFWCCSKILEIKGDKKVESIVLADAKDENKKENLKIDGLFIEIGYKSKTDWLKGLVDLNNRGEIKVNDDNETSLKGIFAAGDCTDTKYKQIVISAGAGAKAALQAYKYIASQKGESVMPDWGKCERVDGKDNKVK